VKLGLQGGRFLVLIPGSEVDAGVATAGVYGVVFGDLGENVLMNVFDALRSVADYLRIESGLEYGTKLLLSE